jgi:hypothetical protein
MPVKRAKRLFRQIEAAMDIQIGEDNEVYEDDDDHHDEDDYYDDTVTDDDNFNAVEDVREANNNDALVTDGFNYHFYNNIFFLKI